MAKNNKNIMLKKKDVDAYIKCARDFYNNDKDNVDELVELEETVTHRVGNVIGDLVIMKMPKATIFKALKVIGCEVR